MPRLVLITGTGRSGTSTMSGTLFHLGLQVPGPYLGANASNPKGFFESAWAVGFHKELTAAAGIHEFDSRPTAFSRVQAAIRPEHHQRLARFLAEQAVDQHAVDQLVVKDPRSVWAQALWREEAERAGYAICYLSMLRHPAEVVGSRATYYANPEDAAQRRRYEVFNVARWINGSLVNERETRGQPRAFVRYTDLLAQWRPVLTGVAADLGLVYDVDPASGAPSPVDEFIDPGLRRHQVTWAELEIPAELQDIAEQVWAALEVLADAHGHADSASAALDDLDRRYQRLFAESAAISHDAIEEARTDAFAAGRAAAAPAGPGALDGVGGRDLLRALGSRAARRLRRA